MSGKIRTALEVEADIDVLQKYNADIPVSLLNEQKKLGVLDEIKKSITNLSRKK